MAIQSIVQEPKYEKKKGSSLLDKAAAGASLIGSAVAAYGSGGAAWATVPAAALHARQTFQNKGYTQQVAPGNRPEVMNAMDRRAEFSQQNPQATLEDARAAIYESDLDPQTKRQLEAPILKALQSRSMA